MEHYIYTVSPFNLANLGVTVYIIYRVSQSFEQQTITMPSNKQQGKRERSEVDSSDDSLITISRNDLRIEISDVVKTAVNQAVNEAIEAKISDLQGIRENMDIFSSEIDRLSSIVSELKNTVKEKERDIKELKKSVDSIKRENLSLKCQMNDLENQQRKENIRVSGLPELASENPTIAACEFLAKKGIKVKEGDVHVSHRIGKMTTGKPRPLIVRFHDRTIRNKVIRERKVLKGSGVTVSEDVSHLTMQTLVRVQKSEGIVNAWIWNARVCARHQTDPSKTFVVAPFQDIAEARGK